MPQDDVSERDAAVLERMRLTFDLFEASVQMQRLNLRRRHPEADDEEIERRLVEWLHTRPGAEHGDASGPHFRVRERK
ncbi:MAG: hypothetical protein ACOC92_01635 [bacterium]